MSHWEIREAEEGDVKQMADLDRICFALPWSEEAFAQDVLNNNMAFYLVCMESKRLVGYAGLWGILDEGHITNVAVHPDFQRQGIGRALLSELFSASEKRDIHNYTLEVRPTNEAALRLYRSFDFAIEGVRKGYYEDNGEDALIMWKRTAGYR